MRARPLNATETSETISRGLSGPSRDSSVPMLELLQKALEDTLPSDPDGYTVAGECVAEYRPSASEAVSQSAGKASWALGKHLGLARRW